MKILIICNEMISLTGSPMYNYTLAMELAKQGHDVTIFSVFSNNEIRMNIINSDFKIYIKTQIHENEENEYDLTLVSQNKFAAELTKIHSRKIINIIHSEYDAETPIISPLIDHYIAVRPSIKEHLIKEHGIPENKISVVYNGVDFERFNPQKRKKHDGNYTKVVLPCTIDDLRLPFLEMYCKQASKDFRVYIYGHQYRELPKNKWVFINDARFDIENYIADADLVAGILLGRVNLEAYAMKIPSYIHDPENPEKYCVFEPGDVFWSRHDISEVAFHILDIAFPAIPCTDAQLEGTDARSGVFINSPAQQIFTEFYKTNHWGDKQSISGTGSNFEQTKRLIEVLPMLFDGKTVLDLPCGDFFWMKEVIYFCNIAEYVGADIVVELINNNNEKYTQGFIYLDILTSELPKVNLIFCRDCLVHFPFEEIKTALRNMKDSGSQWLLTTSFPGRVNVDIKMGEWRPINLQAEPFNLPAPLIIIPEGCTENGGAFSDKSICLWNLQKLEI